jgi:hypothetical protein
MRTQGDKAQTADSSGGWHRTVTEHIGAAIVREGSGLSWKPGPLPDEGGPDGAADDSLSHGGGKPGGVASAGHQRVAPSVVIRLVSLRTKALGHREIIRVEHTPFVLALEVDVVANLHALDRDLVSLEDPGSDVSAELRHDHLGRVSIWVQLDHLALQIAIVPVILIRIVTTIVV